MRTSLALKSIGLALVCMPVLTVAQSGVSGITRQAKSMSPQNLFNQSGLIRFTGATASASYNYLQDTSGMALGAFRQVRGTTAYDVSASLSVTSIPFTLSMKGSNGIYTVDQPPFNNLSTFRFNREEYLSKIKSAVKDKLSPEQLAKETASRIARIQQKYELALKGDIAGISRQLADQYHTQLGLPDDISNVAVTDEASLRSRVLSQQEVDKYLKSQTALQEIAKGKSEEQLQADSVYQQYLGNVKRYEALEKVYNKAVSWQRKFQSDALVKELKNNSPLGTQGYGDYLNNPANAIKTAKENFSLNALQRVFCNVTRLDLGQSPLQGSGQFSAQNIMNNGINTAFASEKASIGFVYGKNNNTNQWLQSGLTSAVTNEYSSMTGITLGTGSKSLLSQSIAINLYNMKNGGEPGKNDAIGYLPSPAHNNAVITLHTALPVGGEHKIEVELSKSFGSFANGSCYDSLTGVRSKSGSLLGGGGQANYAGIVNYEGKLWETDVKAYVKKVGLGYDNPGNYLLRRGETQYGLGLNRQFYQRKLTVKYQIDYRNQQFDPTGNYSFNTLTNKLQTGYRFKRNNKINLTYQRSDYQAEFQSAGHSGGSNVRWQADGAYQIKRWHKTFMNNSTVSWMRFNMPLMEGQTYKSASLLFTHTTSVMLKQNMLTGTLVVNRSGSEAYYFNTSQFNAEAAWAYPVTPEIRLSSGAGYYTNTGWNKQLGISQQASATVGGKWELDVQAGYRKAIQTIRPELANQLYLNSAVRYHF